MMFAGTVIPPLFVYAIGSMWLGWVFFTFGFIGFSLGIFEANFLNVLTPLGPVTKSWAIMGYPAAFAGINVVGMSLVSLGMPVQVLFWYIALCVPVCGLLLSCRVAAKIRAASRSVPSSGEQEA